MNPVNWPQGQGFYWARYRGFKFWNLILSVYGDVPFLRIDAWDMSENKVIENLDPETIQEFGPLISLSGPDIEGARED